MEDEEILEEAEIEVLEIENYEEYRGRKIVCTCEESGKDYCELHNLFA